MRTPDLPPECYPATIRLPACNLPMRDDNDLIDLVGRFCGEDARSLLKDRLALLPMNDGRKRLQELMDRIAEASEEISCAASSIERAYSLVCKEFVEV